MSGKPGHRAAGTKRRQGYTGQWETEIWNAPCKDPVFWLGSAACAPCVSYHLRKRALGGDLRAYTCCAGHMPCSGKMHEQSCPELCLATEVGCCFANSVVSTRYLIQDTMIVQNTQCDNCLVGFLVAMEQLACIFRCAGDLTGNPVLEEAGIVLTLGADLTYCSVCSCMQTQHKLQLDARDEGRYVVPAFMAVPPGQTMDGYGAVPTPQQGFYA